MNNELPKRPRSVWVLTITNGLIAAFMIAASIIAERRGFSPGQAAFSGLIGLGVTIAAHATWYGYRTGRLVLLILLTAYLGLLVVQSFSYVAWAETYGYRPGVNLAILRGLGSLAWLAANWLLLFGKKARVFFR